MEVPYIWYRPLIMYIYSSYSPYQLCWMWEETAQYLRQLFMSTKDGRPLFCFPNNNLKMKNHPIKSQLSPLTDVSDCLLLHCPQGHCASQ